MQTLGSLSPVECTWLNFTCHSFKIEFLQVHGNSKCLKFNLVYKLCQIQAFFLTLRQSTTCAQDNSFRNYSGLHKCYDTEFLRPWAWYQYSVRKFRCTALMHTDKSNKQKQKRTKESLYLHAEKGCLWNSVAICAPVSYCLGFKLQINWHLRLWHT